MKIGLKFFSEQKMSLDDYGFADFIEVTPIPHVDYSHLRSVKKSITLHMPHEGFGFNPADKEKKQSNEEIVSWTLGAADELHAKTVVVHPGFIVEGLSPEDAMNSSIEFLSRVKDKRMLIENMPGTPLSERRYFNNEVIPCRKICESLKLGFCLDFAHATVTALNSEFDYKKKIQEFLLLKPSYFHLSGLKFSGKNDAHLSILDGEIDLEFIRSILRSIQGSMVALETPLNPSQRRKEVESLKKII